MAPTRINGQGVCTVRVGATTRVSQRLLRRESASNEQRALLTPSETVWRAISSEVRKIRAHDWLVVEAHLMSLVASAVSLVTASVCHAGLAVIYLWGRDRRPTPTVK